MKGSVLRVSTAAGLEDMGNEEVRAVDAGAEVQELGGRLVAKEDINAA